MNSEIAVLIIEDEQLWAATLQMSLADYGFKVAGVVSNAGDALHAFEFTEFDIALVDIHIDNKEAGISLGRLLANRYDKPYIFVTSVSDQGLLQQAIAAKPSAFLQKPYTNAALFAGIQVALQNFTARQHALQEQHKVQEVAESFYVKKGNSYKKIDWKEVVYLSTEKNYTKVFTANNEEYLIRSSLQKTLQLIIPIGLQSRFLQLNRAEAVQRSFILEVQGDCITTYFREFTIKDAFEKEVRSRLKLLA